MLLEQPAVLGAEQPADFLQVVAHVVEDALETLLVLQLAVELLIHLVRVGDRRDRLVRAGIRHPGPRIGAVGDSDTKLERTEPGAGLFAALKKTLELLIDRNAAGPPCRCI